MTRAEIRALLLAGRVAFDDGDAAVQDGFRRRRKRELGRVLRRKNYTDARDTVRRTFDVLLAQFSDPEPGHAPAVH